MRESANNQEVVDNLRKYVLGNWTAVRRTLKDETVNGCSAESHASHMLSDRLSSRPMGWSKTGADRMSKLRCYAKNYGEEKIIDLVKYSRAKRKQLRTGTDDIPVKELRLSQIVAEHHNQLSGYYDRLQTRIPGIETKRMMVIRAWLNGK